MLGARPYLVPNSLNPLLLNDLQGVRPIQTSANGLIAKVLRSALDDLIFRPMTTEKTLHYEYLQNELKTRIQRNPYYSLRSFARDLSVSAAWLSEFLSHKKGMSVETAENIALRLGLTPEEKSVFLLSVQANHSRSKKVKRESMAKLNCLPVTKSFKMREQEFAEAGAWYHQAILELTELPNFEHTFAAIAGRLKIPVQTAKSAIESLKKLGLLAHQDGKFVALYNESSSTWDRPSGVIRNYHNELLKKASQALHEQHTSEREFQNVTFAFDDSRVAEAQALLREMQAEFTRKMYRPGDANNSVYQFSIQFFRLDKRTKTP